MPPLITSWISGGQLIQVITAHEPPESLRQWQARHDEAVAFWMSVYPKDE